ncbi:MAG: beta-ketoacyl-[acyl-carrier-protein] synthase family protein [Planctomycetota bacterium]
MGWPVAESVVITGMGVVCPIGVGLDEVWSAIQSRRSGVRRIEDVYQAGWITPYGGTVEGFEAKKFVKPRKSLKVMADEIQWAFAAGEQAWAHAGLSEEGEGGAGQVDPERVGVVCGAGLLYCDMEEMERSYKACVGEAGGFDFQKWGKAGLGDLFPLWMLKYLPNMAACHIGIRRDARGPTNSIAHGDTSALLAMGEAADMIRRGVADVMITGGSSRRLHMTDPMWSAGAEFWKTGQDPATACRPFDARRTGPVCGEGAAMLVLESRRHAQRRGAKPIAEVLSVADRADRSLLQGEFTGECIEHAITAALAQADVDAEAIGFVNAHGMGDPAADICEAKAIRTTLDDTPVTAPKSFIGNLGAAGGAVEIVMGLLAAQHGQTLPTLNYEQPDPACPVSVTTQAQPLGSPLFAAINFNTTGQAAAAVLAAETA